MFMCFLHIVFIFRFLFLFPVFSCFFYHLFFSSFPSTFSLSVLYPTLRFLPSLSAARTRTRAVLLRPLAAFDRRTQRLAFQQWSDFHQLARGFAAAQSVANQWRLHRAWEAWNGYVGGFGGGISIFFCNLRQNDLSP